MNYRPEIDGLRTVAVIPVILFHLGYSFIKGGYLGVDVFFVISGYLITKILTNDIEKGNFSMYRFWIRRVKRLLPLLLSIILLTLIIAPFLVFKPVVKDISNDIFPSLFSYFNFHALFDFGNYWGGKSEESFFLHTWSLSVEEQFYLVYPFFLFLAYRYFRNFIIPIFVIALISFCLFVFYLKIDKSTDFTFYMLPTRVWELAVGGLAGLISVKKSKLNFHPSLLPIVGIFLIVVSYFFASKTLGFSVLLPVLGTAILILFCTPNDNIGKMLSTKIFVFIGKISYSLYLWHWIIIVLFKNLHYQFQHTNSHLLNGIIVILTFFISYLSYTFIENKTRNNKYTPKLVLLGIVVISGLTLYFQSNLFSPFYKSEYNKQISYVEYFDISPSQSILHNFLNNDNLRHDVVIPKKLQKYNDAYKKGGIIEDQKKGTPKVMLIGDSHGVMWAKTFNEIANQLNTSISCYTSNGVSPFFNISNLDDQNENAIYTQKQRIEYAKSILINIEKWKPKLIVFACRWDGLNEETKKKFEDLLSLLEQKKCKVLVLTQPPVLHFMTDRNASQYFTYLGLKPINGYNLIDVDTTAVVKNNDYIQSLSKTYSNVSVYDVCKNMIDKNKVKISLNKEVLYFDDDHLSYYGTSIHKDNILSIITQIKFSNI